MRVKDEDEDDQDQIKVEPDENACLPAFARSAPEQHIKGHHRLFPAGVPLKWDAPTSSADLSKLVLNRDKIHAVHRQAHLEALRQTESDEAYAAGLVESGTTGSTLDKIKHVFNAWCRYCDAAGIPPFPISYHVLALALVARLSSDSADGGCTTFLGTIQRFKDWTDELWAGHAVLVQLEALGDGEEAVRAYIKEHPAQRRPRITKPAKQSSARAASPSDVDDEADDDASGSYGARRRRFKPSATTSARARRETDSWIDLPCPGLPLAQESFDTLDHLFYKVIQAVFAVYGSSCRFSNTSITRSQIRCGRYGSKGEGDKCPFNVVAVRDPDTGRWSLDAPHATTSHDHEPHPKFLEDSEWRPTLINPIARAALGLAPIPSGLKRSLRDDAPEAAAAVKKAKHLPPPASTSSSSSAASTSGNVVPRHRALGPPLEPRLSSALPPTPTATATATANTPSPRRHSFHSNLSSWLAELDPTRSLDVLAPYLLENGVDSFAEVFSLIGNPKKVWQLTTKISRSVADGELDDILFEFGRRAPVGN
ncbi:hypothetical protein JCM9279_007486 [Rhodotorula babjevae]